MYVFTSYTLTWWQIGIFKVALLAIGLAIGAYWHQLVRDYITALVIVAIVTSVYIAYISLQQVT